MKKCKYFEDVYVSSTLTPRTIYDISLQNKNICRRLNYSQSAQREQLGGEKISLNSYHIRHDCCVPVSKRGCAKGTPTIRLSSEVVGSEQVCFIGQRIVPVMVGTSYMVYHYVLYELVSAENVFMQEL